MGPQRRLNHMILMDFEVTHLCGPVHKQGYAAIGNMVRECVMSCVIIANKRRSTENLDGVFFASLHH